MNIDLFEWLKYLGLTFAVATALGILTWVWTWTIEKILKAAKATMDAKSSLILGPRFRLWVRKEIQSDTKLQKSFPKDKYPDYYE